MKKYQYKVKGVDYTVEIAEVEGNIAKVNVNGMQNHRHQNPHHQVNRCQKHLSNRQLLQPETELR